MSDKQTGSLTQEEYDIKGLLRWAAWALFCLELVILSGFFLLFLVPYPNNESKFPAATIIALFAASTMLLSGNLFVKEARIGSDLSPRLLSTPPLIVGLPTIIIMYGPIFLGWFISNWHRRLG